MLLRYVFISSLKHVFFVAEIMLHHITRFLKFENVDKFNVALYA